MKVLVIGIDGLDYNLVEVLKLKNLIQKSYGKLDIPPECFIDVDTGRFPYTPKVWEALLTGEKPSEEETRALWIYKNPLLEKIRWLPIVKKIKGKRLFLRRIGIKLERKGFRIPKKTILHKCQPSIYVNVPGINPWDDTNLKINELIDEGKINTLFLVLEKYMNDVFNEFRERVSGHDYKIAMVYTNVIDYIGHLCWYKCFNRVIKLYKKLDARVGKLLDAIEHDASIIISDHGMRGSEDGVSGEHTKHLFYSTNIPTQFKDIYEIPTKIMEWANSSHT